MGVGVGAQTEYAGELGKVLNLATGAERNSV